MDGGRKGGGELTALDWGAGAENAGERGGERGGQRGRGREEGGGNCVRRVEIERRVGGRVEGL